MRVYLAASYSRRVEMRDYARQLEAAGHRCTSRWIHSEIDSYGAATPEELTAWAGRDLADVLGCDCLILFSDSTAGAHRGGRHTEFGIALAMVKRLILMGVRENVFHFLPSVELYATWDEALQAIGGQRGPGREPGVSR